MSLGFIKCLACVQGLSSPQESSGCPHLPHGRPETGIPAETGHIQIGSFEEFEKGAIYKGVGKV